MRHYAARSALFFAAALVAAFTLTACSSGGGGDDTPDPFNLLSDERGLRLRTIVQDADVLLVPRLYLNFSNPQDPEGTETRQTLDASCAQATCTIATDTSIMVQDIFDLSVRVSPEEANLGSRGGFDTLVSTSRLRLAAGILGEGLSLASPSVTNYGFWGREGFAGVLIGDGPLTGTGVLGGVQTNVPLDGNIAMAFAAGNVRGTNPEPGPSGNLDAAWDGIVEAISTRTFDRREGTVRIAIGNLLNPLATVTIMLGDSLLVAEDTWTDLPVMNGAFGKGTHGLDYLEGNFHGSDEQEAYGVFDTDAYTGAFGAIRAN